MQKGGYVGKIMILQLLHVEVVQENVGKIKTLWVE